MERKMSGAAIEVGYSMLCARPVTCRLMLQGIWGPDAARVFAEPIQLPTMFRLPLHEFGADPIVLSSWGRGAVMANGAGRFPP
jgi:hypothetical protein